MGNHLVVPVWDAVCLRQSFKTLVPSHLFPELAAAVRSYTLYITTELEVSPFPVHFTPSEAVQVGVCLVCTLTVALTNKTKQNLP